VTSPPGYLARCATRGGVRRRRSIAPIRGVSRRPPPRPS